MLALLICVSTLADAQQVHNLRIWHSPDRTRVVFDVSADVKHSVFELQNPTRLVVDIENANLTMQLPALESSNPHLQAVRSGTPKPGVLRFVFELKKSLAHNDFVLSPNELYGHRLVLDLNEKDVAKMSPVNAGLGSPADEQQREQALKDILAQEPKLVATTPPLIKEAPSSEEATINNPPIIRTAQNQSVPKLVVAIDAGHGGEDPGATGHRGSREKKLTLEIAKRLKSRIDQDPRMRAELIRTGDYYIELNKRRLAARKLDADIFISIHADAFRKKSARGFSVFALSQRGATSAMARALAAKENASDLIGGVSLADKDQVLAQVLVDLSMTNTISESVNLGGRVLKELKKLGKLHSSRVEQAGFAVLKSPDMPSILVETGFITNPEEERRLRSSRFQKKLANAIYLAVEAYYQQTPHQTYASYAAPKVGSSARSSKNNSQIKSKSSEASAKNSVHIVRRGESLSKLSAQYNITIRALKRLNKLSKNTLYLGQKIKLSAGVKSNSQPKSVTSKARTHRVKRGDTLSEIAQKYGSSIRKIMSANKMKNRTVMLGQTLKIPR